jgi:outer membrane lipoprotein SlyB
MNLSILKHAKYAALASVLVLGACSTDRDVGRNDGAVFGGNDTGRVVDARNSSSRLCIECGTVRDITAVDRDDDSTTGVGAVVGAIVGGVAGRQVGGGRGQDIATVAGAVAGGVAGNEVEKRVGDEETVYDVRVRMEDGSERVVTVADASGLDIGDPVMVDGSNITIR